MIVVAHAPQSRVEAIGREIFERARDAQPSILDAAWWNEKLLDWAMHHERLKVQLFRFIDVLPALDTDEQVARHLQEYFGLEASGVPSAVRRGIRFASPKSMAARKAARVARAYSLRVARQFIAGENAEQAIRSVERLRDENMAFTVDVLGEATTSHAEADRYLQTYLGLLDALPNAACAWPEKELLDAGPDGPTPRVNLSVKLSSLAANFDEIDPRGAAATVLSRLRPVLRRAREVGAFINVDMEQYRHKDLTFAIFREVLQEDEFRDFADVGIVVQTYLTSAERDLNELIEWVRHRGTPITVRLVKGAYWDYETVRAVEHNWPFPVFTEKWRSDATYERLTGVLMENHRLVRPALASHNVRSLAVGLATAQAMGLPPRDYELQMLYGMGDPLKVAVVGMGRRLRVYAPYGELIPGMAYLIRRLLENTSNESFLRQSFSEDLPIEELLADPEQARPPSTPPPRPIFVDFDQESEMTSFTNAPLTDFADASNRQSMTDALIRVKQEIGREHPLMIAGRDVTTGAWLESVNPARPAELIGRVAAGRIDDVAAAVNDAERALSEWRRTSADHRADLLNQLADHLWKERFSLAALIVLEVGKPWAEADADVAEAVDFCRFYGQEIRRLVDRSRRRDFPGEENRYRYEPRGVAAVIAPWNFPLAILTGMATAAVAAGNTVILKPAEQSPVIAAHLVAAMRAVGFPSGVVQFLPGDGEVVGRALVEHPRVGLIAFTGSREVGCAIYEAAAKLRPGQTGLKKVISEMGGKNAIIIDDDADLDEAVAGVVASAFGYAGQKCSACSRVIVHAAVHDRFVKRLVDATASLEIGPPEDPGTQVGPVIDAAALEKTNRYIAIGRDEAELALTVDVSKLKGNGFFAGPSIFTNVAPTARLAQEEIFGPVLAVLRATTFDEALAIANRTDYALTGGLYSRSPGHVEQAKHDYRVGNLYINRSITGAIVDRQPFGGFKMSGIGSKAGGPDYLQQYMEPRTVTENTLRHGWAPTEDPTANE